MGSVRFSSRDSFCRVTSITRGFTPHATDTLAITAAASSPVPPVTAAQYASAGWSGHVDADRAEAVAAGAGRALLR